LKIICSKSGSGGGGSGCGDDEDADGEVHPELFCFVLSFFLRLGKVFVGHWCIHTQWKAHKNNCPPSLQFGVFILMLAIGRSVDHFDQIAH
jgi:hypothetical protein